MAYSNLIGDIPTKAVEAVALAIPFPTVTVANLADVGHPINNPEKSGKKLGACAITETGVLYVSTGALAASPWKVVTTTEVTPA
ncbi:hypothetical protein EOPP23_16920 [Endozoicomonas sp. OPT23]|uniref:hypothetical protein n=1 Tax=Endozoicomonas sp. OPT23 TaxID=2072845 RepID=UPI00129BAF27|nr:hypothetical protein [Endozoicomonas sp. OPT23]MRI34668.1 hypothetical protein [Endozoicomonas sp. OPT23]